MNLQQSFEYWVILLEIDVEFVVCMEEVLDIYELFYDFLCLMVCMDEQLVQFVKEICKFIEVIKVCFKWVDYEYEWVGIVSIFMFCEFLVGWC